jgi:hypothetical protein
MTTLRDDFPALHVLINWAKGYYRSNCLQGPPYLPSDEKLARADRCYQLSYANHTVGPYLTPPSHDELLILVG